VRGADHKVRSPVDDADHYHEGFDGGEKCHRVIWLITKRGVHAIHASVVLKKRAPRKGLFELRTLRVIRLRHVSKALHVPVPLIAALGRFALSPTRVRSSVYNISGRGRGCGYLQIIDWQSISGMAPGRVARVRVVGMEASVKPVRATNLGGGSRGAVQCAPSLPGPNVNWRGEGRVGSSGVWQMGDR